MTTVIFSGTDIDIAYIAFKKDPIRLCAESRVAYHEKTHHMGHRFGESKSYPMPMDARWSFPGEHATSPDVRRVPDEAKAELARIDAEIGRLKDERQEYIVSHFRQWPLVHRDEVRQVPGKTKAQCLADWNRS